MTNGEGMTESRTGAFGSAATRRRFQSADMPRTPNFCAARLGEAVAEMMECEFIRHSSFGIISSFVIRHSSFFR
jgi:hypothetical protein